MQKCSLVVTWNIVTRIFVKINGERWTFFQLQEVVNILVISTTNITGQEHCPFGDNPKILLLSGR